MPFDLSTRNFAHIQYNGNPIRRIFCAEKGVQNSTVLRDKYSELGDVYTSKKIYSNWVKGIHYSTTLDSGTCLFTYSIMMLAALLYFLWLFHLQHMLLLGNYLFSYPTCGLLNQATAKCTQW